MLAWTLPQWKILSFYYVPEVNLLFTLKGDASSVATSLRHNKWPQKQSGTKEVSDCSQDVKKFGAFIEE